MLRRKKKRIFPLIDRPTPVLDALRGVFGEKRIGVDMAIERMKEEKRREWETRGYPPGLIEKALKLSDEWVLSMAQAFLPGKPELQKELIKLSYAKALDVASRWIEALGGKK